ncbi:MAG: glycosyltransferase family 2 protein [Thermoanaerobaculia bacterium]|nr:glycosyltransferase family 2 protein [Thermoanaerobaculia bacterium]
MKLTALLMVKDEEDRLVGALRSVAFASETVVVDTGSSDGTRELARERGARVEQVSWQGYAETRNAALSLAANDWVLFLDADERVSPELAAEIERILHSGAAESGFLLPRLSYLNGRPVRHGVWVPDYKLRLARRSAGFRCEGGRVHEVLTVEGAVGRLSHPLVHHPYRNVSDVVRKAAIYARLAALDRYERGERAGFGRLMVRPALEFLKCYLLRLGFLDGTVGVEVAALHSFSYFLRAAYLLELDLERKRRGAPVEAKGGLPA